MAAMHDSKSCAERRVGSTPTPATLEYALCWKIGKHFDKYKKNLCYVKIQ